MTPQLLILTYAALSFGCGAYVVNGLLDPMAAELNVSPVAIGQLQTAFILAAAVGGPVIAILARGVDRKRLLIAALAAIAAMTAGCALANGYLSLIGFRMAAGVAGGVVMPSAAAIAAAVVSPERRGTAIALVLGGMTLAFLIGIPLGTLIGGAYGWRATFVFASALAGSAAGLAAIALPPLQPTPPAANASGSGSASWAAALPLLLSTLLSLAAAMAVVSYLQPILSAQIGVTGREIGLFQAVIGAGAVLGLVIGGRAVDRGAGLGTLAIGFLALGLCQVGHWVLLVRVVAPGVAIAVSVGALFVSSIVTFGMMPIVQARLVALDLASAPLRLAVNGSMNYVGQGLGAGVGGLAIAAYGLSGAAAFGTVAATLGLVTAIGLSQGGRALTRRVRSPGS